MLARLLWFVLAVLLVSLFKRILSYFLGTTRPNTGRARGQESQKNETRAISGQTVKDPVCGTHVATSIALSENVGGKKVFFCSEECRRSYMQTRESS